MFDRGNCLKCEIEKALEETTLCDEYNPLEVQIAQEKCRQALAALHKMKNSTVVDESIIQGILKTLDYIERADKTPQYGYEEPCADGRLTTVPGQRFLTPKELAQQELEYLDACGIQRKEGKSDE